MTHSDAKLPFGIRVKVILKFYMYIIIFLEKKQTNKRPVTQKLNSIIETLPSTDQQPNRSTNAADCNINFIIAL